MKTIKLFYTGNGSDKEYRVQIVKVYGDEYAVKFQFGRRCGTLAEGTKTRIPVSLHLAETIFAKLVNQKKSGGYTEDRDGQPFGGNPVKLAEVLPHPSKEIVSLQTMRNFSAQDYLKLRKYDGELCGRVKIGGATFLTEFMRTPISGHHYTASDREMFRRFPGGWHAVLTVASVHGENVLMRSTRERWGILCSFASQFTPDIIMPDVVTFDQNCMDSGAEGICAVAWDSPWGNILAVKQSTTYLCRITKTGGTQSCGIERIIGGENLSVAARENGK